LESLSERFFSSEHLDTILRDYSLAQRFTKFLQTYRPQYSETLRQYVEARKAIVAVEYARAVAQRMTPPAGESPLLAANLDSRFELHARRTVKELVEEALPAYLTHRLVSLVTDTLVKEITGNSAPIMHELIPSLAEVYCISDPSVPDNPIVYASEEFYNTTRYSKQHAIGRNCRFLQGPKTSAAAVRRLIECLSKGEEVTETLLNYRRDGTPFMNLLMIAPLYDNKGTIRYFLGAQIDVSSLIEGGRGLESFAQLLSEERRGSRTAGFGIHEGNQRDPPVVLGDLGQLLTDDESEAVKNRAPRSDSHHAPLTMHAPGRASQLSRSNTRGSRIVLGVDEAPERPLWPDAELGRNGRLPGVYQNYLLVRPYPSLRITFTSPSLRIPGLLQTKLLDRIGGPASVREALQDALTRGGGVTAKVTWLTSSSGADVESGKIRWLHCTPMLGSDERVGVWMVVVCDDEKISGSLRRDTSWGGFAAPEGAQRFSTSKLYADYLKREGRASRPPSGHTQATSSTQARREAEDQFRDF
jgi:PAS domain S-box-containing protein